MTNRALELRRAFDQTFAEPARAVEEDPLHLLAIQVGGDAYALRLDEIAGLFVGRTVVSLPSPRREFLGLAGLRGDIVPVYSLGGLLGYPAASDPPRFVILARTEHTLGLAFDEFVGYLRIPRSAVLPSRGKAARAHVPEAARLAQGLRGVVSLRSIAQTLQNGIGVVDPIKEQ